MKLRLIVDSNQLKLQWMEISQHFLQHHYFIFHYLSFSTSGRTLFWKNKQKKSINKHIIVNKGLPNGYILLFFVPVSSSFFFKMNMYAAWFKVKLAMISYSLLLFSFFIMYLRLCISAYTLARGAGAGQPYQL